MESKVNKFKKAQYKIGDKLQLLEMCPRNYRYVPVKINKIIDKGLYNLYLCKNLKSNCTITFTDKDLNNTERGFSVVRG